MCHDSNVVVCLQLFSGILGQGIGYIYPSSTAERRTLGCRCISKSKVDECCISVALHSVLDITSLPHCMPMTKSVLEEPINGSEAEDI